MVSSKRILGIKFIMVSIILLTILLKDATFFAHLLNFKEAANLRKLQLFGAVLIIGCIFLGYSLLSLKHQDTKRLTLYCFMAALFIVLPFAMASSPFAVLHFFE